MRAAALSMVVLPLLASTGSAQVDQDALRKALRHPSVSVIFNFGLDSSRGWAVSLDKPSIEPEIKVILAEMKDDASDAERYYRLGWLYPKKEDWTAAFTKAKELFQRRLANNPDDGYLLARLGTTVWELDDEKGFDLIRASVDKSPKDWRCWAALGEALDSKSGDALPYKKKWHVVSLNNEKSVAAEAFDKKPTPTQLAQARKLRLEAKTCYDRAVALAPREPQVYLDRARSTFYNNLFEHVVANFGKRAPVGGYLKMMTTPEVISDLQKAAELDPRNSQIVTLTVIYSVLALTSRADNAEPGVVEQVAEARFRSAEKSLRATMTDKDKRLASEAATMLGTLLTMFKGYDEKKEAESLFRRAVALNPGNLMAIEMLFGAALAREAYGEAVVHCRERLKLQETPKYRFLLAKVLDLDGKSDKAEVEMRACVKSDPDDPISNLGLAVLLIKQGDAASLKQAGDQLNRVEKLLGKASDDTKNDYDTTQAILLALQGNASAARSRLRAVLKKDSEHPGAKDALEALK